MEDLNGNKKKRTDKEVRLSRRILRKFDSFVISRGSLFQKIESTKQILESHRRYAETLERISNLLQKNLISVKKVCRLSVAMTTAFVQAVCDLIGALFVQISEIRDEVEDYLENGDQQDYKENLELFDDLELDKFDSSASGSMFTSELGNLKDQVWNMF